jgi:Flp pilus assembly protein CpaB
VSRHRRRSIVLAIVGVVLALLALERMVAGGAAPASESARVARVVAIRLVPAGDRIVAADLGVVRVPAAGASPHQLARAAQAVGRRTAVTLVAGAPVMDAELAASPALSDARAVAVRLDDSAGIPAGDLTDARADVYVTPPGRRRRSQLVLAGVVVLSASRSDGASVATLLLPARAVPAAIAAEAAGSLRLVVHTDSGGRS